MRIITLVNSPEVIIFLSFLFFFNILRQGLI